LNCKYFDAIVIGGGIAGATVAYQLKDRGMDILLIDKSDMSNSSSMAAGAFLSPKISKPSPYKEYLNRSFNFTTNFYKRYFKDEFLQCGLLKYPLNDKDERKVRSYEEFIDDIDYQRIESRYYFKDAGIILPESLLPKMISGIKFLKNYHISSIRYADSWMVDGFKSKYLIFANSNIDRYFDLAYIKLKSIGGYRYKTRFEAMKTIKHNLHKDISISAHLDGYNIIGATHIKESLDLNLAAKNDSYKLLERAKEFIEVKDIEVLEFATGDRVSTYDYFPIVGRVVDQNKTLQRYPYIKKGSKVPSSSYIYHKDLFLHTALSSRGFVTAPYNAKLIADLILKDKDIDDILSTVRLFKRWARKI